MINKMNELFKNLTITNEENGKFLGDKAYAYDDIYFMAKFIKERLNASNVFNKRKEAERINEYTKDIFQLRGKGSGAQNYMTEALAVFTFSGIIKKINNDEYKIINMDVLDYLCERIENSYIYLYMLVYKTFSNDGLLEIYEQFAKANTQESKREALIMLYHSLSDKCESIGARRNTTDTNWAKQKTKYGITVLGYANDTEYVTRTLNLKMDRDTNEYRLVNIRDASINIEGTRTNSKSKKINDYIDTFSKDYVLDAIYEYLIDAKVSRESLKIKPFDHIAEDLADLKIENVIRETDESEYISKYEQDQFIERKTKTRNQNIQKAFKDGLLSNNAHKCPVCGFEYEDLLIASHIKPYKNCEDVYDAINECNGFLMCPNHDKLFEGAKLMTIDYKTGEIKLSKKAKESKDFGYLEGKKIDKCLIECERKHYLKWHNDEFNKYNIVSEIHNIL